jgi:hypothetical protein
MMGTQDVLAPNRIGGDSPAPPQLCLSATYQDLEAREGFVSGPRVGSVMVTCLWASVSTCRMDQAPLLLPPTMPHHLGTQCLRGTRAGPRVPMRSQPAQPPRGQGTVLSWSSAPPPAPPRPETSPHKPRQAHTQLGGTQTAGALPLLNREVLPRSACSSCLPSQARMGAGGGSAL